MGNTSALTERLRRYDSFLEKEFKKQEALRKNSDQLNAVAAGNKANAYYFSRIELHNLFPELG